MKKIFLYLFLFASTLSFAQTSDSQLTTAANVIRNETVAGANTALRVGNMFNALINYKTNINFGVVATGTDTYAATIANPITNYTAGDHFIVKFTNANTGAATLNINLIGPKAIMKHGSTALDAGDIIAGRYYLLIYDGTNLQIVDAGTTLAAGSGLTKTGSTIEWGGTASTSVSVQPTGDGAQDILFGWGTAGGGFFPFNRIRSFGYEVTSSVGNRTNGRAALYGGFTGTGNGGTFGVGVWNNSTTELVGTTNGASAYWKDVDNTSAIKDVFSLHSSTGTNTGTAAGYGVRIPFVLRNAGTNIFDANGFTPRAGITYSLTDATVDSEDSKYTFSTVVAGSETTVLEVDEFGIKPMRDIPSSTGTSIAFDRERTYGDVSAETGNITINTTGLRKGVTQLVIHNSGSTPTFGAECKIIGGAYVTSVDNYIFLQAVSSTLVLVTISQEL
jgi:hypothetical protein